MDRGRTTLPRARFRFSRAAANALAAALSAMALTVVTVPDAGAAAPLAVLAAKPGTTIQQQVRAMRQRLTKPVPTWP